MDRNILLQLVSYDWKFNFIILWCCCLLFSMVIFLAAGRAAADPTTVAQAAAFGDSDSQSSTVPYGSVPNSSEASATGTSSSAMARALNTGVLGAAANNTGNVLSSASALITDKLTITLSEIVPTADGMAILMHLEGQMSLDNTTNSNAETGLEIRVTIGSATAVGRLMLYGAPFGKSHPLQAPPVDTSDTPIDNLFLHPRNQPFYPIGQSREIFNLSAPLYVIMKGVSPSTFITGREFNISLSTFVQGAPGTSSFYNSMTFDSQRPVFLYSNILQDILYLPWGSTYNSATGMGIPTAPTEPEPNPPTPNPMVWEAEPYAVSPTSISMTATTATPQDCPPVSYYFEATVNPTGNPGEADSGWQSSTEYTVTGLVPNHQYGFVVTAASCFPVYQETDPSSEAGVYTLAEDPVAAPFTEITRTTLQANWSANGNPSWTEYWCENMENSENSGWITNTFWNSTGLTPGDGYHFRVKARNGDNIETGWVELGSQETVGTINLFLPLIIK